MQARFEYQKKMGNTDPYWATTADPYQAIAAPQEATDIRNVMSL